MDDSEKSLLLRITHDQVLAFQDLSSDRNPAHVDPDYARSTQFAQPVVFGMCGVILGLSRWANGRLFRLKQIQGIFARPLCENEQYELTIQEHNHEVRVRYRKGPIEHLDFSFTWEERGESDEASQPIQAEFLPRRAAETPFGSSALDRWQKQNFGYRIRTDLANELLPCFGLEPTQMPLAQLNALLGSSYFVGMEFPGQQALYSEFEFRFEPAGRAVDQGFQFQNLEIQRHKRYPRFVISGHGTGIAAFSLVAFERPLPVRFSSPEIKQAVGQSELLKDKVVFISGATRGFGAVLARIFALQGADLALNYRSSRDDAEALAADLKLWNSKAHFVGGDVSSVADCRRIRDEVRRLFGKVDILVANAWPHISAKRFIEQEPEEFARLLAQSVSTFSTPLHELVPLMPRGGTVIGISTIYTRLPQPQFSHYVAAKSALEGLIRTMALEFQHQRFLLIRPPRMLTDQTNLVYDPNPPISPIEVGRRLLEVLKSNDSPANLAEIDL